MRKLKICTMQQDWHWRVNGKEKLNTHFILLYPKFKSSHRLCNLYPSIAYYCFNFTTNHDKDFRFASGEWSSGLWHYVVSWADITVSAITLLATAVKLAVALQSAGLSCLKHLINPLLTSLHPGFQNHFILHPFFSNAQTILVLSFQIIWILEFMRQNSWHMPASFLPFFYFSNHFNLSFDNENILLVTVDMLSLYQSPVNCKSIIVDSSYRHKEDICQVWNLYSCLK
jgi:hypothetical protein